MVLQTKMKTAMVAMASTMVLMMMALATSLMTSTLMMALLRKSTVHVERRR